MAGISTTISRKDLEFMAEDIGEELIAVMTPEKMLKGMDQEKQRKFISLLNLEDLLAEINPEKREQILKLLLKMQASGLTSKEDNKNSTQN